MATRGMKGRMGGESDALSPQEAASLLAWWLDAGVDVAVAEEPRNWLAPPARAVAPSAPTHAPSPAEAPADLHALHSWLREASDLPLFRSGAARALPHGPAEAEIMLVSGLPDRDDAADGRPIGGEAWTLTTRMLAAIGFTPEQAYVASLTCFPAAGTRLADDEARRCAEQMKRHIGLVAPRRLLLLGDAPAKALLGAPMAAARGKVHRIDGVPTVATFHPRHLMQRPGDKALAWRDLLLLMSETIS